MSTLSWSSWHRGVGSAKGVGGGSGGWRWVCVPVLAASTLSGCGLFEDAGEKQRRLRELELELTPIANGAEERAQGHTAWWVLHQALLADVLQEAVPLETITTGWGLDHVAGSWRQARSMALHVLERLYEELDPADAGSHPLAAQVLWAAGLGELYLGMTYCTAELDDERLSDAQLLRRAERTLGVAIETARRAGTPEYLNASLGARAQARMLLDDWNGAEEDAMQVPAGFSYVSYHTARDPNPLWQSMSDEVRRYGLLHKWWPLVEESEDPGFMIDPWSGEEDPRIPVHYDGGTLADSDVPRYRPLKYDSELDDVPIVHYDLARLVIAEAKAERGEYGGAAEILNELRAAVGLPPHDTPASAEEMEELILWERFAELHLEGQRLLDLHRKGLMESVFEELDDPERPGVGRPSKWGDCEG